MDAATDGPDGTAAGAASRGAQPLRVIVRARWIWTATNEDWATVSDLEPHAEFDTLIRTMLGIAPDTSVGAPEAIWQLSQSFAPSDALNAAIEVQHDTRTMPRSRALPFHAVVVIAVDGEDATAVIDAAHGGQVLVTTGAYEALRRFELADYYRWDERPGGAWECGYDTPLAMLDPPFERMFAAEMNEWVLPRRGVDEATVTNAGRGKPADVASPFAPDVENELFGIALSGGGMRSATFSLGVLQSLARNELLAAADYISSVSGGGYVGASLAGLGAEALPYEGLDRLGADYAHFPFAFPQALMHGTARPRSLVEAETQARRLPVHGNEAPALWHIRKHANLLGSGIGLFDLTTWLSIGRYVTSTLALWLLFRLPILGLAAGGVIVVWLELWDHTSRVHGLLVLSPLIVGAVLLIVLGGATVSDRRLPERAGLLRVLRTVTFAEGVALMALAIGGSAWLIEHGADWYATATTSGTFFGGLLAAVGSRLFRAAGRWKAFAARVMLQSGGLLLLGGIMVWSVWFAAYLLGATDRGALPPLIKAGVVIGLPALIVLAVALVGLSLHDSAFARGLLNRLSLHDLYETRIRQSWIVTARKRPPPPVPGAVPATHEDTVARWTDVWPAAGSPPARSAPAATRGCPTRSSARR